MSSSATPPLPRRPRAGRSFFRRIGLGSWRGRFLWLLGLCAAMLVTGWVLVRSTPGWYRPLDPADNGVEILSSNAQSRFMELSNSVQRLPLGDQKWTISQDELNALLAVGSQQVINPSTSSFSDPFVVLEKGRITFCARLQKIPGTHGGVGSATFAAGIVPGSDGTRRGLVKLTSVWAGNLPLPKSIVQSRLPALRPGLANAVQQIVELSFKSHNTTDTRQIVSEVIGNIVAGEPFPLEYHIENRDVILKDLVVDDGSLTIVLGQVRRTPLAPR